jgi:hypothetical protein
MAWLRDWRNLGYISILLYNMACADAVTIAKSRSQIYDEPQLFDVLGATGSRNGASCIRLTKRKRVYDDDTGRGSAQDRWVLFFRSGKPWEAISDGAFLSESCDLE